MATKEDNRESPKTASKNSCSVGTYAALCETCLKWRVIATQEEYEEIRSKILENPFTCDRIPGLTCEDPADIECNATRIWVIDRPGTQRPQKVLGGAWCSDEISPKWMLNITPTGKKLRTKSEIAAFLEANPKYENVSVEDFNITSPNVMEDTIPEDGKKVDVSGSGNTKIKALKDAA